MKSDKIYSTAIALLIGASTLTMHSCIGDQKKQEDTKAGINPKVEEIDNTHDESILVTLNKKEQDSIWVTIKGSNKKKALNIAEAVVNDKIKGSLTIGNTLSIFPDSRNKRAKSIINLDELIGRWMYDMNAHRGLKFDKSGGMTSINAEDICFRQWKFLNGKLYLFYLTLEMVAENRNEYLVEPAEIIKLSKEALCFKFLNKTFNCRHQTEIIMMTSK